MCVENPLGATVAVTFHPQRWVDEVTFAADERATFRVPRSDATDDHGVLHPDDTYESDQLKWHDCAPMWVQTWDGPFYITITR